MPDIKKECDCCEHTGTREFFPINHHSMRDGSETDYVLCKICYVTFTSKALLYPNQCDATVMKSMAMIGNMILDAIEKAEPESVPDWPARELDIQCGVCHQMVARELFVAHVQTHTEDMDG